MADFLNIKMARREKNILLFGAVFLVVVIMAQFVVAPWFGERSRLISGIASREKNLRDMTQMQAELTVDRKSSHGLAERLRERAKNFALFSYLENAAGKNGVKKFITYMKPSAAKSQGPLKESLVEMKLAGVSLEQLHKYLQMIESTDDVVYLKRVSIQSSKKKKGTLDAVLQVLTYTNENQ